MNSREPDRDTAAAVGPALQSTLPESPGGRRLPQGRSFDALKVLAGLTAASGLLLHLVGSVFHDAYLSAWGLDSALFPKSVDHLVILGFKTVVGLSLQLFPTALANVAAILVLSLGLSLYWSLLGVAARDTDFPNWAERLPRWLTIGFARFLAVLLVTVFVILFVVLLGYLMAAPIAIAQTMARQHASVEMIRFSKGCAEEGESRCFDLKRGTEVVQGFLIDSSTDNIAFYDVALQRARVTARVGSEMLGRRVRTASATASSVSRSASAPTQ